MTHKAHLKQRDPRCDTRVVLQMARHIASRSADMNAVSGKDRDWNFHWSDSMTKNHFNHIKPSRLRRVRACTHAEGSAQPRHLTYAQVKKYRKRVGGRWLVPFTVQERQKQARGMGVRIFWELKSAEYGTNPALAKRFKAACSAAGGWYAVMTLTTMKNWAGKLKLFHDEGFRTYAMRVTSTGARLGVAKGRKEGWITGIE